MGGYRNPAFARVSIANLVIGWTAKSGTDDLKTNTKTKTQYISEERLSQVLGT
jgi:hypothetical protein